MERHAADELHIEVAEADGALRRLTNHGKRLGQHAVERLAVRIALAEELGLVGELLVVHLLVGGLEAVDLLDDLLIALELLIGAD